MESKPSRCLKAATIILSVLLVLLTIGYFFTGYINRFNFMALRGLIPTITEDFEQSRERFEILRSGQFAAIGAFTDGLRLSYGSEWDVRWFVDYGEWHTIEWLSDKERDAIIFLTGSEELELNFMSIGSGGASLHHSCNTRGTASSIQLLFPGTSTYISRHDADPWIRSYRSHIEDLGDGYRIWVYTTYGFHDRAMPFSPLFRGVLMSIIITVSIVLFFLYRKLYIVRAESRRK